MTRRVAAIDIGSNTLLLLCAERRGSAIARIADCCRFGRLAQGLDVSGLLAREAIVRCLDILDDYRDQMKEHGITEAYAVATEAVRKASNARTFVEPAEEILGCPIEVISGEREAALTYRAVRESLPALQNEHFVIADVGGASTEIIVARGGEVVSMTSLPIGAVRLTERHVSADPPGAAARAAIDADIDRALAAVELPRGATLVASAGSATSLAAIELELELYDPDRVHGFELSPERVEALVERLFALPLAEKRELPGLEPARADVIASGAAIFSRLLRTIGAPRCVVSDRGVRWGVVYERLG